MSYKPDKSTLMDYLYGELNPDEKHQVDDYLSAHPEERIKLEELDQTRKFLGNLTDKSVERQILISSASRPIQVQKPMFSGFVRNAAAVTILLGFLMLLGKFTNANLQIGASGFAIAFSENEGPTPSEGQSQKLDREEIVKLIQTSLHTQEKGITEQQQQWQQEMEEKMVPSQVLVESRLIDQITKKLETRMDTYFASVQYENANLLATYWGEVAIAQKNYMNLLLEDYANGLQQLREEDLLYLQERLNGLQIKNYQLEQEVSEILEYLLAEIQLTIPSNP
ncbi:anti-sigma factor family protein [Lunatibacter salilacus]|uniref:anti-sigma factor family protein n=1 Tax=Lunatibacter salilacus TaxID=2483804 RepID=UPI00131D4AC2|nr:hypothetical protein [Lunatibacter salilacus]